MKRIAKSHKNHHKKLEAFIQLGVLSLCSEGSIKTKCQLYTQIIEKLFRDSEDMKSHMSQLLVMIP